MRWRNLALVTTLTLSHVCVLQGQSRVNVSQSGVDFWVAASDRMGGVWIGGSVFGIEGLLLNSKPRCLTPLRVSSVSFIEDVSFVNKRFGWVVGSGFLYHTKDAGQHWHRVELPVGTRPLNTVYFVNARTGWVAGQGGLIFSTTDGGLTWRQQDSTTTFSLEKIRFVDQDNGWATGSDISPPETRTLLLLTRDGGGTWRKAPQSDLQQFRSVMFVTPHSGWAVNSNAEVVQTLDGGETWWVRRAADGADLESVFFVNESQGWAIGNGIVQTIDGGKTWNYQMKTNGSADDSLNQIIFSDALNGWAIGLTRILKTNSGGARWEPLSNSWKADVISRVRQEKFKSTSN